MKKQKAETTLKEQTNTPATQTIPSPAHAMVTRKASVIGSHLANLNQALREWPDVLATASVEDREDLADLFEQVGDIAEHVLHPFAWVERKILADPDGLLAQKDLAETNKETLIRDVLDACGRTLDAENTRDVLVVLAALSEAAARWEATQ